MNEEKEKTPKIRFRDGEQKTIRNHITNIGERYVYAEPFPLTDTETIDMIEDTIPPDMVDHLDAVRAYDKYMVSISNSLETKVEGFSNAKLSIWHSSDAYEQGHYRTYSRMLHTASMHHSQVSAWMCEVLTRKKAVDEFDTHVRKVFYHSNTPGQVKTVYPALVELLPPRMKEALNLSTRTTRWPSGLRDKEEFLAISKKLENMIVLLQMVANGTRPKPNIIVRVEVTG